MDHDTSLAAGEEDASLPKATVAKIINEMLPPGVVCARETRDLLIDCSVEFIHLVSSEANAVCERSGRKTMIAEHVAEALKTLGFEAFLPPVLQAVAENGEQIAREKERAKASNKMESSGLTQEELQREQEELFAKARLKMSNPQNP